MGQRAAGGRAAPGLTAVWGVLRQQIGPGSDGERSAAACRPKPVRRGSSRGQHSMPRTLALLNRPHPFRSARLQRAGRILRLERNHDRANRRPDGVPHQTRRARAAQNPGRPDTAPHRHNHRDAAEAPRRTARPQPPPPPPPPWARRLTSRPAPAPARRSCWWDTPSTRSRWVRLARHPECSRHRVPPDALDRPPRVPAHAAARPPRRRPPGHDAN